LAKSEEELNQKTKALEETTRNSKVISDFLEKMPSIVGMCERVVTNGKPDIRFLYANAMCREYYKCDDLLKNTMSQSNIPQEAIDEIFEIVEHAKKAMKQDSQFFYTQCPLSYPRWFKVLFSSQNENTWSFVSEDVTEMIALQQQLKEKAQSLEEALNIKSRFLAVMSHG
jgi:hypothetical protein